MWTLVGHHVLPPAALRRIRTGAVVAGLAVLSGSPAWTLSYVESSTGLSTPTWDDGYSEVEFADLDGDGRLDLISMGDHGNPGISSSEMGIMVWFGNGAGSWTNYQTGNMGYGGIAVGDVNGDGKLDIGYGVHHNSGTGDLGDQILEVALGDGTGRAWTAWDDGLASAGETYGMFGSDFADVDGDGDLDLGSISFGCCSGVHVYLNDGDGAWTHAFGFLDGNSREEFVFGDVDNDGWPDLAVSHDAGTVYLGNGRGGFVLADSGLAPGGALGRTGVALGDVNGDGRDDLAWINPSGGPEVWIRSAAGSWSDFSGSLPASGSWEAAQLWDMDGDGIVDLAAFGNGRVDVWKGNGSGGWTSAASFTLPSPGSYHAFRVGGDADHNGRPDIALVDEEGAVFTFHNHLRFFREATAATTLRARVVHPGANALLRTGTVRFVDWASEVPSGGPGTAKIEFSRNGTSGPWETVASGIPNNGRYQWRVPDVSGSSDFRIRVTVTAGASSTVATGGATTLAPGHDPLRLLFSDRATLTWTDGMARASFNLYRGSWDRFRFSGEYTQDPATVPDASRWCAVSATSQADPFVPAPGALDFYLVTGRSGTLEGSLGTRGDGTERPNAHPCP